MVKTFILYYLSLKSTHGYEIQKFIQINHLNNWTKIQSGSIYYALAKLEKEGLIQLQKEQKQGNKIRKVYEITEAGSRVLREEIKAELGYPIYEVGSDKFIIYPLLQGISSEAAKEEINRHLEKLKKEKVQQEKWQKLKLGVSSLKVEQLCFEMMISSLDYQIRWHEALLEEFNQCLSASYQMAKLIQSVDFSALSELPTAEALTKEEQISFLKQEILAHPEEAAEKLEQLIGLMK